MRKEEKRREGEFEKEKKESLYNAVYRYPYPTKHNLVPILISSYTVLVQSPLSVYG